MKLVFVSDIHGSAYYARMLPEIDAREKPERIVLLGDLLYHGPRNDLPRDYNPKEVTAILNGMKQRFLCVRGNCDAEVDQMVLEFPIEADSLALFLGGRMAFVTHGHLFNTQTRPSSAPATCSSTATRTCRPWTPSARTTSTSTPAPSPCPRRGTRTAT